MKTSFEDKLRYFPSHYLTETELTCLVEGTADSRYGKVKRLLAQGKLLHIRRGLYCLTQKLSSQKPHLFELAQSIYGPSYISLESALAYHGLIPEAVYTVTSACTKRASEFHTPLAVFSYAKLPVENFYLAVDLITENNSRFFMAKPWKAIGDYVFCYKKDWDSLDPLVQSLRIDRESLPALGDEELESLLEYYHQRRLSRFFKGIKRELNNRG